jgi:hypothetical protein
MKIILIHRKNKHGGCLSLIIRIFLDDVGPVSGITE